MNTRYSNTRKIDPSRGATLGDGTPNDANRIEIGPTQLAFREWETAGLQLPNLEAMRAYRHKRLTQHIVDRGYGGLLMFDPLNIRYATDSTNMQLWNTHNPFRAVLLLADGYMLIWDYKNSPFLSTFNPLVREQRSGADLFYFDRGDKVDVAADVFANEVRVLMAEHAPGNMRLAVDKVMLHGLRALEAQGFEIMEGEEVTEKSRAASSIAFTAVSQAWLAQRIAKISSTPLTARDFSVTSSPSIISKPCASNARSPCSITLSTARRIRGARL